MSAARPTTPVPRLAPAQCGFERTVEEWAQWCRARGEPEWRGRQIFTWLHRRAVFDPASMTDLPRGLRAQLEAESLAPPLTVRAAYESSDRTRKLVLQTHDERALETVIIPQLQRADPDADEERRVGERHVGPRITQCVSTQLGCAMGCAFCASGVAGLRRHLTAAEIVGQLHVGRRALRGEERLRNVVLMGMGEPLHNYDAVARALWLAGHPDGLGIARRRITVSTCGLVPEIERLGRDFGGQIRLALSLHAVDDERRSAILPINRRYPIAEVLAAIRRYPRPRQARITIEYTLLAGFNDALADADALVALLRGIPVKVNLIPVNPVEGSPYRAPSTEHVESFRARVAAAGIPCIVRVERGGAIDAACGQLALAGERPRVRLRRLARAGQPSTSTS
ncbi:MAG: 23S rRNA (adenine(2503)-C(2))-methyltransferase RlmN [Myxococcota bacterium]|nr:23S rRNA (adenine(2503)-C(2))-methyltransferase RlmN [Myxococcota bacterium]MDW8362781.1 23S rRNA (adenine(2503)-C(2))-methyltransferase RlmN [Myxococcales bacterium]